VSETVSELPAWSAVVVAVVSGAVPSTRNSTDWVFSTLPLLSVAKYSTSCSPSRPTLMGVV
jgi:hypothetical protein